MRLKSVEIIDHVLNVTGINASRQQIVDYVIDYVKSSLLLPYTVSTILIYAVYACLFLCGACGNCWAVVIMIGKFRAAAPRASTVSASRRRCVARNRSGVLAYALSLSFSNLFVVLTLPLLMCTISIKRWLFGPVLCKFYYVVESGDKFLSVFLLTGLSFERYLSVCRPRLYDRFRRCNGSGVTLVSLIAVVTVLLTPVYVYGRQYEYDYPLLYDGTSRFVVAVSECSLNLDQTTYKIFTWYVFALAFCLPSLLIVYFYTKILLFAYCHTKSLAANGSCSSRLPLKRLTTLTLALVGFYFACWTPYWVGTLHILLTNGQQMDEYGSQTFFALHTFVYVNSAFNWLFFVFMNTKPPTKHRVTYRTNRS